MIKFKPRAGLALLGAALLVLGGCAQDKPSAAEVAALDEVIDVKVVRQPAGEYNAASFNDVLLHNFELQLSRTGDAAARSWWEKKGRDPAKFDLVLNSKAHYDERYAPHVAIVDQSFPGAFQVVTALGIAGDEIVRVVCIKEGAATISTESGPCAEGMDRNFARAAPAAGESAPAAEEGS